MISRIPRHCSIIAGLDFLSFIARISVRRTTTCYSMSGNRRNRFFNRFFFSSVIDSPPYNLKSPFNGSDSGSSFLPPSIRTRPAVLAPQLVGDSKGQLPAKTTGRLAPSSPRSKTWRTMGRTQKTGQNIMKRGAERQPGPSFLLLTHWTLAGQTQHQSEILAALRCRSG
jgi:hypothetical protein